MECSSFPQTWLQYLGLVRFNLIIFHLLGWWHMQECGLKSYRESTMYQTLRRRRLVVFRVLSARDDGCFLGQISRWWVSDGSRFMVSIQWDGNIRDWLREFRHVELIVLHVQKLVTGGDVLSAMQNKGRLLWRRGCWYGVSTAKLARVIVLFVRFVLSHLVQLRGWQILVSALLLS